MAVTQKSPGVATREIDLSGPTAISPQGTPAGVIGTSEKGRAFVPVTFATFQDYVAEFGSTDGEKFGPLAVNEWMRNAKAGTYVRVLGTGDAKRRQQGGNNAGKVLNAGFVVGDEIVQTDGIVSSNPHAVATGPAGRTFFLGSFLKAAAATSATVLTDAGISISTVSSYPLLRGVLLTPSGVSLTLSSSFKPGLASDGSSHNTPDSTVPARYHFGDGDGGSEVGDAGLPHGTVDITNGKQLFVMLLNGHVPNDNYSNVITASFDPTAAEHFSNVFNTDPTKLQEAGHYLHAWYDVYPSIATPSAVAKVGAADYNNEAAILVSGSAGRDTGTSTLPNFENFEDRFRTAKSPWFISQKFGGRNKRLFKVHAIDDGASANDLFKVTIENIAASNNLNYKYGSFDLIVRDFYDSDADPIVLEAFRGLSLDPTNDRYIARIIGDRHAFYDFDQPTGRQKLRIEGSYPNSSRYVRVEMDTQVTRAAANVESLPVGFEGPAHLNTCGANASSVNIVMGHSTGSVDLSDLDFALLKERPIPMRTVLTQGTGLVKKLNPSLTWGIQFEAQTNPSDLNASTRADASILSYTKYFPSFQTSWLNVSVGDNSGTPDVGTIVLDSDVFNKNKFTLENIQVVTGSTNKPLSNRWGAARYCRNGNLSSTLTDIDSTTYPSDVTRFLDPTTDFTDLSTRQYAKFTCFVQGGFDGLNIFDSEKSSLTDIAIRREYDDELNQGGTAGPTVSAYRKAIDVLAEKSDVDIQLLAIPGIRHPVITDYAIDAVEDRFDAMFIMDIEERDQENGFITGSSVQVPSVSYTVDTFKSRNLDTSFAAAYYPDVIITDPTTRTNVVVPPSAAVLGAFALNDAIAYPWFAPAGFTRGALSSVIETQVKLNRSNMDSLYEADINPITSFPDSQGVVVFGQKTLQMAQTALDRVNVRRLLIEIRRRVRRIANSFIFEPNRAETLSRFSNLVNPVLQQIQSQNGVDRFKVQIDTSTTTQADVENNTVRGKIYIQPTRSVEFISIDFAVTNQGAAL